jgi:SpoVK/Ycf46/Vps4 family AAA+-type ATPase
VDIAQPRGQLADILEGGHRTERLRDIPFDEFDAVAQARGSGHDVGEMERIVTSFLHLLDSDRSHSILIATTNHSELLT